jgi:hypothetical protein
MENGITISRDGINYGPYSEEEIHRLIASQNISPDDLSWRTGMSDWRPLRAVMEGLSHLPKEAPPTSEQVFLQEDGIYISDRKIQLGANLFVPGNIGGVSIQREGRRSAIPAISMFFFGIWALGCLIGMFTGKDHERSSAFIGLIIFLPLTIWCARRVFAPRKITLQIAASGGMQNGLVGTDPDRMNRIAAAIQRAILSLVALLSLFGMPLQAQDASPTPQQLHLLVVKVDEKGVLADKMEPHENSTVRRMRATGSPLAGGMIPAGVDPAGLACAMEPVWRPSGTLVFVKGEFPGIAEGDQKVVKAIRNGAGKITSQKDGEVRTIALYEMQ